MLEQSSFSDRFLSASEGNSQSGNSQDRASSNDGFKAGSPSTPTRSRRLPRKLYRIGEVVEYAGVSRQTIHNYTTMGLIQEASWTQGGHRLYDEEVFDRLDAISQLKAQRRSLGYIREYFAHVAENTDG
jgi:hypothetical protein